MNFWSSAPTTTTTNNNNNNTPWPTPGGDGVQRKQLLADVRTAVQLVLTSCPSVFDSNNNNNNNNNNVTPISATTQTTTNTDNKERLGDGETVYDHSVQLNALGFALEQALKFGMRDHSSFFRKKDYWNYLKKIAKLNPQATTSVSTVENLSNIKTPAGRGRAWIRIALVEKQLSNYLRQLSESRHYTLKWYEQWSILRNFEELEMLCGMLQTLHVVEFSLCLKDVDFDSLQSVDLQWYLHNTPISKKNLSSSPSSSSSSTTIIASSVYEERRQHHHQQQSHVVKPIEPALPAISPFPLQQLPLAKQQATQESEVAIEGLKEQLEAVQRELEAKKQVALSLLKEKELATGKTTQLEKDLLAVRKEKQTLSEEVLILQHQQRQNAQQHHQDLELRLSRTLEELVALRTAHAKEVERLKQDLLELKARTDGEIGGLTTEKAQLNLQLHSLQTSLVSSKDDISKQVQTLEREKAQLQLELQQQKYDLQQLHQLQHQRDETNNTTLVAQKTQLEAKEEKLTEAMQSIAKLESEKRRLNEEVVGLQSTLAQMRHSQVAVAEEALEKENERRIRFETEEALRRAKLVEQTKVECEAAWTLKTERLEKEIADLQQAFSKAKDEALQARETSIASLVKENETRDTMLTVQKEVAFLKEGHEAELRTLNKNAQAEKAKLEQTISTLEQALQSITSERDVLAQTLIVRVKEQEAAREQLESALSEEQSRLRSSLYDMERTSKETQEQQLSTIQHLSLQLKAAEKEREEALLAQEEQTKRQTSLISKLEQELSRAFQGTEQEQQVIERLRNEIQAARVENESYLKSIQTLSEEKRQLQQESQELQLRLQEIEHRLNDTKSQLHGLQQALDCLEGEKRATQQHFEASQRELHALREELESTSKANVQQLQHQQTNLSSLQEERARLTREVELAREGEERLRRELSEERSQVLELTRQLGDLKVELQTQQHSLEQLRNEHHQDRNEKQEKDLHVQQLVHQLETITAALNDSERERALEKETLKSVHLEEITGLKKELSIARREAEQLLEKTREDLSASLKTQHDAEKAKLLAEGEEKLTSLQKKREEEVEQLRSRLEERLSTAASENSQLTTAKALLEQQLQDLIQTQTKSLATIARLEQDEKRVQEQLVALEEKRRAEEVHWKEETERLLQRTKETLGEELSRVKEDLAALSASKATVDSLLTSRLEAAESARAQLIYQLQQQQEHHTTQLLQAKEAGDALLRTKKDEHRQKMESLSNRLAALELENQGLKQQQCEKVVSLEQQHQQEIHRLTTDLELLKEKTRNSEEQSQTQISGLQLEMSKFLATKVTADQALQAAIDQAKASKDNLQIQLQDALRLQEEAKCRSEELQRRLDEKELELRRASSVLEEKNKQELEKRLEDMAQLQDAVKRLVETKRSLEQQLQSQLTTAVESSSQQQRVEAELRDANEAIGQLQQRLKASETAKEELLDYKRKTEQSLQLREQRLQSEMTTLLAEKNRLERSLEDTKLQNDSLILALTQMTSKMEEEVVEKINLQQEQKRTPTPAPMIADHLVHSCMDCKVAFSFTKRKHHCRLCGRVLCSACSNNKVIVTAMDPNNPTRLCNSCYTNLKQQKR